MKHLIQKHKNKLFALTPLILIVLISAGAFYILGLSQYRGNQIVKKTQNELLAQGVFENLNLDAKSYAVYDDSQKKIISSKNLQSQLPLASLTKIMASLVALDLAPRDYTIDIPKDNEKNFFDKTRVTPGKWRLDDLLRFTLVSSSNSGINVIATSLLSHVLIPPGINHFTELMNNKAKNLRLNQTFFLNESGLDINKSLSGGYGSAKDMVTLFDTALSTAPDIFGWTKFNSIVINSQAGIPEQAINTNPSVSRIDGLIASKTGLTDLAGGNLIIAFDMEKSIRVIVVVLGSSQDGRFKDTQKLIDATINYYKILKQIPL